MYIRRKIDQFLQEWKSNPDRLPLIVKGARQIGKTESVLHFAESYENVVYLNFVTDEKFKKIVQDSYKPEDIVKNITLLDSTKRFIPHKTLIIFDEIQEFPEITTSLKFFKIQGLYDVICTGSLLGIHYKRIQSVSVGYKMDYEMKSLDFEEYLWAKGYPEQTVQELLQKMTTLSPFSELEMQVFMGHFRDYCVVGGMPRLVATFIENGNFQGILEMQRELIQNYKEDVRKYAVGLEQTRITSVLNHIPVQLAKENKKFQITKVEKGARSSDYWGCIEWLNDAGLINIAYCMSFPELPLKGNYEPSKYKLYFFDTGMLVASLDEDAQEDFRANQNFGVYKGALYESIVGESLVKQGYELYYYKRDDSKLEQDFFVRTQNALVPIEVKAQNGNAKSMKTLISSEHYGDIKFGIKFCHGNVGYQNNIFTFPYFCSFLLKRILKQL